MSDAVIKQAFAAVRKDFRDLQIDHQALKLASHEWITHLERSNQELSEKVKLLEQRLSALEGPNTRKVSLLREI